MTTEQESSPESFQ